MADENRAPKVDKLTSQAESDRIFVKKAELLRAKKGNKLMALRGKNKLVGLLLAGGVLSIYGYTIFSVQQGKMLDAFDKVPE